MKTLTVLYFASLRDAAGVPEEHVRSDAADLRELYTQLQVRHGFSMPADRLRVAVDDAFADWETPLRNGSRIALIPPVSGG